MADPKTPAPPVAQPGVPSASAVKDHAFKLAEEARAKRGDAAPLTGDLAAGMMPDFSKGTAPLDDATGKPIVAAKTITPTGTEMAGPAGGTVDELAAAKAEISGTPKPPATDDRPRDPSTGQFVPAQAAPLDPDVSRKTTEDAAAQALATDPWADVEEVEYEDPTIGKFTVRAPKSQAAAVRNAYLRQTDYTRKTTWMAKARPLLEPLVASGQIDQVLPLIQRAFHDQEFAQFVGEAYAFRQQGQSLGEAYNQAAQEMAAYYLQQFAPYYQQAIAQAQQAQRQQPAPGPDGTPTLRPGEDPYMDQYLRQSVGPLQQQLQETQAAVQQIAAAEQQRMAYDQQRLAAEQYQQQQLAAQQYQQQAAATSVYQAHQELIRRFPDEFTGDLNRDNQSLMQAIRQARESGYIQQYQGSPLSVVLGYEDWRNARLSTAASPAAAAINAAQQQRAHQEIAAQNAGAVASGAPATNTYRRAALPPPPTRGEKGATDIREYAAGQIARLRQATG